MGAQEIQAHRHRMPSSGFKFVGALINRHLPAPAHRKHGRSGHSERATEHIGDPDQVSVAHPDAIARDDALADAHLVAFDTAGRDDKRPTMDLGYDANGSEVTPVGSVAVPTHRWHRTK